MQQGKPRRKCGWHEGVPDNIRHALDQLAEAAKKHFNRAVERDDFLFFAHETALELLATTGEAEALAALADSLECVSAEIRPAANVADPFSDTSLETWSDDRVAFLRDVWEKGLDAQFIRRVYDSLCEGFARYHARHGAPRLCDVKSAPSVVNFETASFRAPPVRRIALRSASEDPDAAA